MAYIDCSLFKTSNIDFINIKIFSFKNIYQNKIKDILINIYVAFKNCV